MSGHAYIIKESCNHILINEYLIVLTVADLLQKSSLAVARLLDLFCSYHLHSPHELALIAASVLSLCFVCLWVRVVRETNLSRLLHV